MSGYRQARKDDSSDDEAPTKRVKQTDKDDDDVAPTETKPKGSGRHVWSDVVLEESIAIGGIGMNLHDKKDKTVKIRRGAETYTVPTDVLEANANAFASGVDEPEMRKEDASFKQVSTSDDPFGDTVDLGEVEGFGVGSSTERKPWYPRGRGGRGGVRGGWMQKSRQASSTTEAGESMELGEGANEGGARGGRGGFRGAPRGRGMWYGNNRGGGGGYKRRWNDDQAKDPAELMTTQYSLAALMATEFPEGLPLAELGDHIAKALGEKVTDTVVKIVEAIGEKKALALFDETRQAEAAGGLKVADGSRRRTPGGVFILLFKSSPDVEPSVKDKIFEDSREQQRRILKSKRRGYKKKDERDVGQSLDQLQELLDQRKKELEQQQEALKEVGEPSKSDDADCDKEELDYGSDEDETPSPGAME